MCYTSQVPVSPFRQMVWLCLWLFTWLGFGADAAEVMKGLDSKKVVITLEGHFLDGVPERGSIPLHFRVQNLTGKPGRWTFRFSGVQGWNNSKKLTSERVVEVDARSSKNVQWEIPVFPNSEFQNGQDVNLDMVVSGPGTSGVQQRLLHGPSKYNANPAKVVGFSPELQITRDEWNYSDMVNEFRDRGRSIRLLGFNPSAFPAKVSGLSGVDILLMTQKEWDDLRAQQPLLKRWIAGGGHVWLVSHRASLNQSIGLGNLKSISYMGSNELLNLLERPGTLADTLMDPQAYTRKNWALAKEIPAIKNSFGFIMLTVILIAALLGPINVWLSFRRKRPIQVIWTTPVISVALSLLVALGIVFSDGFGGKGARALMVLLVPDAGVEVTVQEQISRTGVLLNDEFSLPGDSEIYMVHSGRSRQERRLEYQQMSGGNWSGDWFENRSIQAQVIRRTRNSRAKVVFSPGGTPQVLSSVDARFSRMLVRDGQGGLWMGEQITPGKTQSLRKISKTESREFFADMSTRKSGLVPSEKILERNGWFYAESAETDRYVDTLKSIRWQSRPVWYMGPVSKEVTP
ncbi:hypothetical protein P0Y35_12725 [Kiritimatiellaeota bacterium B1221]|nr:hypothetical protein [Kiritimatiellaeota bacterium B1221]